MHQNNIKFNIHILFIFTLMLYWQNNIVIIISIKKKKDLFIYLFIKVNYLYKYSNITLYKIYKVIDPIVIKPLFLFTFKL